MRRTLSPADRAHLQLLRLERARLHLQRLVDERGALVAEICCCMERGHETTFPPERNHFDQWECAELCRLNSTPAHLHDPLTALPDSAYECKNLMRHVPAITQSTPDLAAAASQCARLADAYLMIEVVGGERA
jgi:hypothetical protein